MIKLLNSERRLSGHKGASFYHIDPMIRKKGYMDKDVVDGRGKNLNFSRPIVTFRAVVASTELKIFILDQSFFPRNLVI